MERQIDYDTGLLAEGGFTEVFVDGNEPEVRLDEHWTRIIQLPWYLQEPFYIPKKDEKMPAEIKDWTMVREVWEAKSKKSQG